MICINQELVLLPSKNQNLFFGCLFCKTAFPSKNNFKKSCNCTDPKWKFKTVGDQYYVYCNSCLKNLNII